MPLIRVATFHKREAAFWDFFVAFNADYVFGELSFEKTSKGLVLPGRTAVLGQDFKGKGEARFAREKRRKSGKWGHRGGGGLARGIGDDLGVTS